MRYDEIKKSQLNEAEGSLNEFAPNDSGDDQPRFIPWDDFIEGVKGIVGKDFGVKENVVKSTIKARFVPHDPMEFGPTMLYSYYEARAGRNKGAVSTRGSIQVGKYTKGGLFGHTPDQLLTGFHLLKGHPFERHFDLTPQNISKIASIIMGNTEGALEFQPQKQGVEEGEQSDLRKLQQQWWVALPAIMKQAGIDYRPVKELSRDYYPTLGWITIPGERFTTFDVNANPKGDAAKINISVDVDTSNEFYRTAQPERAAKLNAVAEKIAQALGGTAAEHMTGQRRNHPGVSRITATMTLPKEPAEWQNPSRSYDPKTRFLNQPGELARQSRVARSSNPNSFGGDASNYRFEGVEEGSLNEFAPTHGGGGDDENIVDILMNYMQRNYPKAVKQFGEMTVYEVINDRDSMGYYRPEEMKNKDLDDLAIEVITVLEDNYSDEQGVAEGFGSNYAEQLAQQVFDQNPTLDHAEGIIDAGWAIAKQELGPRARGVFRGEDFPGDFISAYHWLKQEDSH